MSRHEGVSCDACLKANFRGKRYKCLICYDYDLCAVCYEAGSTTTRHTTEHPMQCILTRSDYEIYFGGEAVTADSPQSFTCPFCGRLGFTEACLQEHVSVEHGDLSFEVVCPICAAVPIGDPNLVTDDFAGHLTLEHRNPSRDLISFLDEPQSRHSVGVRRNIPAPSARSISTRGRRANMNFSSSGALASISPSARESVDPIAELLSQLSGVRRNQGSTPSQLQHLQMQLQLERQQVRAVRQQLERMPRRQTGSQQVIAAASNSPALGVNSSSLLSQDSNSQNPSQFLLTRYLENNLTEAEQEAAEQVRADKSLFVRHLMLSTLGEESVGDDCDGVIAKMTKLSLALREMPDKLMDIGAGTNESSCSGTGCSIPSSGVGSGSAGHTGGSTTVPNSACAAAVSATSPVTASSRPPPPRGSPNIQVAAVLTSAQPIPVTQPRSKPVRALHNEAPPSAH